MLKRIMAVGLFMALGGGAVSFSPPETREAEGDAGRQVTARLVRPDLVLEKIWTTDSEPEPGKRKVVILYTIFNNSSVPSSCCPTEAGKKAWQDNPINNTFFCCTVESRVLPAGRFNKLSDNQGGVWITSLKPYERQTQRWASEVLPLGSKKEYRVRIDPLGWIWEKTRDNNDGTTVWPGTRTK
jgi:hypothetical protein